MINIGYLHIASWTYDSSWNSSK